MDLGINGKIAVVLAASEGLGKASALSLSREGATVIICSRRKETVEKTAREIAAATGNPVHSFVCDISSEISLENFIKEVAVRFSTIHILVNNAGGPPPGGLGELSSEDWLKAHSLTLMSVVHATKCVIPYMVAQKWGRVISIVSIAAKQPLNDLLISSSIRPGVLGFHKVMANEYGNRNITFNTVCPGLIMTNRQKELAAHRAAEGKMTMAEYLEQASKNIPAGRIGKPEEVGDVVAFLASEKASYINGANLLVDGGSAKGIH